MIEVPEALYHALANNQPGTISPQNLSALNQAGFVVDENLDEVQMLREKKEEIKKNVSVIGLQILPVLFCNFQCVYCYEKPADKFEVMSSEVMDGIISWVRNTMKPTTKVLNVMWFGGEPLLALDQIDYLSKAFLGTCRDSDLSYYSSIVTNGYHLTEKNIDILLQDKVRSAMVTIDGPEEIHDSRRMLRNGGKTWKTIINNIETALKKGMAITIRVNVDKSNIDSIDRLFENLDEIGILNKVGYFLGIVTRFGHACSSIDDRLLTTEETDLIVQKKKIIEKLSAANNFKIRTPADLVGCVAAAPHSYVAAPDGSLYKCTKTIGDPGEICGNIAEPDPHNPLFQKWQKLDNLDVASCCKCSLIPVCRGMVCAYDILKNSEKFENCSLNIDHHYYHDHLKITYREKIAKNKNQ